MQDVVTARSPAWMEANHMFLTTLFGAMSTYGNLEVLDITFTDTLLSG